VSKPKLCPIS